MLLGIISCSCASYKQSILLRPTASATAQEWRQTAASAEADFKIQKNDFLQLTVNSNKGERLIDPNPELSNSNMMMNQPNMIPFNYLVDQNGIAKFPMINELKVEGLTLRQAEQLAQKEYDTYFKDSFVQLTFTNKRVTVLGATGGQVVPLMNQSMKLTEVLALSRGLPPDSKAQRITLVRGDNIYALDLSTIEGFRKSNVVVEPNDIIYLEPVIRPVREGLRDYGGIFSILVSFTTLIVLLTSLNSN